MGRSLQILELCGAAGHVWLRLNAREKNRAHVERLDETRPGDPEKQESGDRIAVVGASSDLAKYGNILVKNLKAKGYTVIPINPRADVIAELKACSNLAEATVDGPIHIVNFVTPPPVTRKVLEEVATLGLPVAWLQEGSFDQDVLDFAAKAPFTTIDDACIMVVSSL